MDNGTGAEFHFQALRPDLILDAIESIGVFPETGLLALNSYENRVYQFRCDQGIRYVVKFYRPHRWSNEQIQEEHDYALALAAEDIPIAVPVVIEGKTLFEYQGYRFGLFPSIGGRAFEVDNLEQLESVGRFIGRIHQYGAMQPFKYRESLTPAILGDESYRYLRESGIVASSMQTAFFTVVEQVLEKAKQIWQQHNFTSIRLHGDLHPSNILWTPDGPGFVDLDDARQGPAVQDLWMMLTGDRQQQLLQIDILLEGYQEFCDFDAKQLALIEPLRAFRMVHYNAWLAKRWDDPAFPMNFPWFGDIKYWEQQTLAFKEQLSALNEPPLSLPSFN
ncbi:MULTISPECIES: serine/threonine protein kinase [Shewanella]|jgi:Ser/Thr protein kinase RdoA (MazF antagonist)|uniref:Stress response kinase A n=1 Tax=Shewanella frigidimarina TaxID=56812 RepID=A0A125BEC1_SHEFR|nr:MULTISPECIES: serine/threonine protein kinase [Shewanella]KVX01329.1 serine/threonine protein kinase [Shewanella frigidimarina]MBB1428219.1 serine/threonine protein kinase [Shewanella sp. SG44-2]PKH98246.1 serine/threonine protein kinase [Shewanella sp. 11B5]RPA31938.1 serine/threonine protein kinase [Shewanella frigidimarina]RPA58700.1 serine/threonine protein kinase [Shewanella frigidimarina]|tara:strand:- start:4162 stop:5163 length:1002 start_codon:yes stop_codon:yes gene_type:complete